MRLRRGQYFGEVEWLVRLGAVDVSVTRYGPGARLPRHEHARPNVCFVLEGGIEDLPGDPGSAGERCGRGAVLMHRPGCAHEQRFSAHGTRCLNIEVERGWLESLGVDTASWRIGADTEFAGRLAKRIEAASRAEAHRASAVVESAVAAAVGAGGSAGRAARELAGGGVESVSALARRIGVDTSHLGRTVRRQFGATPHTLIEWGRVERAVGLIQGTGWGLGRVALEAGFSDQSHMTRVVKRWLGVTPGALRQLVPPGVAQDSFKNG